MNLPILPPEILEYTGTIYSYHYPKQGHTSVVIILYATDGKFVLKKTEHRLYNEWLAQEYRNLLLLAQTLLPVPRAHKYLEQGEARWLLMDYIEGVSLREFLLSEHNPSNREAAIASYGRALRSIHDCACPMELLNKEPWIDSMLTQAEHNLLHFETDGSQQLLDQLKHDRPEPVEQTLIHGDCTIDNVLVRNREIVGVIDWGGGAYGDPRYDLALAIRPKPNAFQQSRDRQIFFEAYGKPPITEKEYLYFEDGIYQFF